jgi:hypothetical protein
MAEHVIEIPKFERRVMMIRLVGDRPLLVNNKMSAAWRMDETYGPGPKRPPKEKPIPDELFSGTFYTMPSSPWKMSMLGEEQVFPKLDGSDSLFGIPASGVKKCLQKGIRPTGLSDNITVGNLGKSFEVVADEGGMILLRHNGYVRDARPVNIGSGQKATPSIRHRPLFDEWELHVRLIYNQKITSQEMLSNLAMHAGQFIGLCELRSEKLQGECGGFVVGDWDTVPEWATDEHWGVKIDPDRGFRFASNGKSNGKPKKFK